MAIEIGRKHSFGIGLETTPGTAVAAQVWIPLETGSIKPMVTVVKDESGYGSITSDNDAHMSKVWSEFTGKGIVRPTSIGYVLRGALGGVTSPSTVEAGVYKHSFTVQNDNNHPAFTVEHDNTIQEEKTAYNMIDSLTISGEVGAYSKFDVKTKGRAPTNAGGALTPTFPTTGDVPFMVSKASVKFAANVAGLAAASKVPVQNFKVTIDKNLEQVFATLDDTNAEAINFNSQHNKNFTVKGDFEVLYSANTFRDQFLAGTKQAVEITLEGRALIGATEYESLTITLNSVVLEDWGTTDDKDALVSQTFGFTGLYKLADTAIMSVDLVNTKSTQYA